MRDRSNLPPRLEAAIGALVAASGLTGAAAKELRDDLETHARDGLSQGRDPDELARRLGDPEEAAPLLAASRPPAPRRPDHTAGEGWVAALATDLRLTLRALWRAPALTAAAMAVLGVGIAATAVAFTVVNAIFLRPLPVDDQDRLVDVWAIVPGGNSFSGFGWQDVVTYRERAEASGVFSGLAGFGAARVALGEGTGARPLVGQLVTADYFPMLGIDAALGRVDLREDAGFAGPRTVVLSHGLWSDHFASDPEIMGRTVLLEGEPFTVVGVAHRTFRGHFIGFPVDLWMPMTAADLVWADFDPNDRTRLPFEMIAKLSERRSATEAGAFLNGVAADLEADHPETHRGRRVGVTPTSGLDHSLRPAVVAFVAVLTVLTALVLIVACLNVGSLLLVRTLGREGELAVRSALGAGRGRLARQLLTEAFVLTGLGAGLGLLLSRVLSGRVDALFRRLAPGLALELPFDGRVLGLTATAAVLAAALAGAAPAWHALRRAPADALRGRTSSASGSRGRALLVAAQVAVSVALAITTGLFVRALGVGSNADPGYAADEVATFALAADGMVDRTRLDAVLDDLRALPGVVGASVADGPPTGVARTPVRVDVPGVAPPPDDEAWRVDARRIGAEYLTTIGVPLLHGRDIEPEDARDGPTVAVVDQAFVERFWPETDPLGQSFEVDGRPVRVVGVAGSARTLVQDDSPDPFLYLSLAGVPPTPTLVTLRADAPEALTGSVRAMVERHAPGTTAPVLAPARQALDAGLLAQRLGAALIGAIGVAALLLTTVGLFGLLQYSVSRDRHALAVRLALGGTGSAVLGAVVRRGLLLVAAGAGVGVAIAAVASPVLSGFLLGVSPRDPLTYVGVVLLFGGIGLAACVAPARRAMAIPPAAVLRGE